MNNLSCFIHLNNHQFIPVSKENKKAIRPECGCIMVELNGIEPMTSCLQGRRSPN
jgi:hypothetical protein